MTFCITDAMKMAEEEAAEHKGENTETIDGKEWLTVGGYWRIIQHEEERIKSLKRQVNRLIAGNTIPGDDITYSGV